MAGSAQTELDGLYRCCPPMKWREVAMLVARPIFSTIRLIDRMWIVFGKQGLCFLFSFNKIVTEQQRKKYGNKFD